MSEPRLYHDLAEWFNLVSRPEEYAEEMRYWQAILRERLGAGRHILLDLGTGGGHHLSHLTAEFDAHAVDLSASMLMFLLIRREGKLRIEQDRHTTGLFSRGTWLDLMRKAGFEAHTRPYVQADYGRQLTLLVGVLPDKGPQQDA